MLAAATLAAVAIVAQDGTALKAAPRDGAAQHALLTPGDMLEVRGERMDYLQVYDHRRERAGYVRASQVRITGLTPQDAPALLAVLRFVRDTPGAESLGIAYAAAYLRAAPADAITAEPFDALGAMAERLARRAGAAQGRAAEAASAQVEAAAAYGVVIRGYESDGNVRLCYDGEAWRRVLALQPSPAESARAALALTRPDCIDPALGALERARWDLWRAEVLDRVAPAAFAQLPATAKNRLRLRRAGVWSAIAFQQARQGAAPQAAGQRAVAELASVEAAELADDDVADYNDAAMRVGASRWAAEPLPAAAPGRLAVRTEAGAPGETCVLLVDARTPATPLVRRCTWGVVWAASASARPDGSALALAVQPLDGWRELWVFRRQAGAWQVDVLPPAAGGPGLGYVEFAGWVPGADRWLLVRETRSEGRYKRSFETVSLASLATDKQASTPSLLALFRWQDAAWKRGTVSLR